MSLNLTVREVVDATPRARIIRLDLDGRPFAYEAGQAVLVRAAGDVKRRAYSLAAAPSDAKLQGCLELLVGVTAQPNALDRVEPGERVEVDGPVGRFTFPADPGAHRLVFIAGGTGIAPLRAMLRHALNGPHQDVRVLYSARTCSEFAYGEELGELARAGRIQLVQTVTREPAQDEWTGGRGRFGPAALEPLLDDDTLCFLCGPLSFVSDTRRILGQLGVRPERVRVEEW